MSCAEDAEQTASILARNRKRAWEQWGKLNPGQYLAAPLVGRSELAWRMLVRSQGTTCAHTPMIDAGGYAKSEGYRKQFPMKNVEPRDTPLVAQFGGSNIDLLVAAAKLAEPHCDAIELNVGCPQRCGGLIDAEV